MDFDSFAGDLIDDVPIEQADPFGVLRRTPPPPRPGGTSC